MKTLINLSKIARSRRRFLTSLALLPLLGAFGCSDAKDSTILSVDNLALLASEAKTKNIPIMLFVTAPYCGYCHQLERDVIVPMLKNARYAPLVLVRRFDLGKDTAVDFDGASRETMRIAARYKAQLTPTVVFLSPDGQQLTDNIMGVAADLDLYGGMIDARINQALEKLGNGARIVHH
jgi:thioredoxin-related protein